MLCLKKRGCSLLEDWREKQDRCRVEGTEGTNHLSFLTSILFSHNIPHLRAYGLVFDAGSSHTALFVYQWPADKENNTGMVSQTFSCHVNASGISSFVKVPARAGDSLRECLDAAMSVIPADRQREAPTYLGATAGMRLLSRENESAATQILTEVSKTIQEYPINFQGARILTGKEEGAYGWITINYLLDSFTKYSLVYRDWIHPSSASIWGALDLGGASTQISFVPAGPITEGEEAAQFRLYGFDYTIYTHSYLCYGQNQALLHALRIIVNSSSSDRFEHPCYPMGYSENITRTSFYSSPCAERQESAASGNVILQGTGNASKCRETFQKIFNFSCGHNTSCGFNGVYQPKVNGKFLAFSAYYYTFNFLNLTEGQPLAMVEAAVQTFCAKNWAELQSTYPKEKTSHLKNYCASANFILTLLLKGYGFNNDTWDNIAFQMQAANSDIGWTLGYMLNLTNMIPTESPSSLRGHEEGVWIASIFFIVLMLALCLVFLLIYFLK
ncbi:ectonucleoside triphosphate diphosphohydrolase 8 isoform X2 [Eublepharis macularius]|uniref:Ectonucleoside triphosphate diphosphohydrolase 8 isoform X2 n=1 Tax=Eublepharis macularius TaxID=481883 RepID=A0AA97LFM6_EUBMA|nr:ectonucleoside triphosphate diphosphohydrolase 8 isoform X2 [Eublepharis macularius]